MKTMTVIAIYSLACLGLVTGLVQASPDSDPSTLHEEDLKVDGHSINKRWIAQAQTFKNWEKGIVPYEFKELDLKGNVWSYMAVFEHETCLRFVHNNDAYKSQRQGGLNFVRKGGCKTLLGNMRWEHGQFISPCSGIAVMHELGHDFGNSDGVGPDRRLYEKNRFIAKSTSKGVGLFDASQPMDPLFKWSVYAKDKLRLFDLNIQHKNNRATNYRSNAYHLFQAISEVTKCKEWNCTDFNLECVNDGFPTLVEGQCACNCPLGLDPATGCATVMKEAVYKKRVWPKGQYAIPATSDGCPDDRFKQMSVEIKGDNGDFKIRETKRYPPFLGDKINKKQITLQLCVMDEPATGSDTDWPTALKPYCFYRKGDTCPEELMKDVHKERFGFSSGQTTILESTSSSQFSKEALPDITIGANTTLSYCCKLNMNSVYEERYPIKLPTSKPFILISNSCPHVDAMKANGAVFTVTNLPLNNSGSTPWGDTLGYCYYTPYNTDCGGEYELSPDKTSVTVTSPASPQGDQCYWLFTSPPGTRMVLNFDQYKSKCHQNSFIAFRRMYLGTERFNPCWDFGTNRTIPTIFNTLMIEKRGKDESFKATISLLYEKNMCYNMADQGESYGGDVSITRDMKPCQPWGKALHCIMSYELLTIAHRLDDNYCRQVGGSGIQPWCYHDAVNCSRHYCDACNKEKPWDTRKDCQSLQGTGFCEKDPKALQECAGTCGMVKKVTPASAKCGPPNDLPGSSIVGGVKSEYSVGDRVVYECTGAPELWQRERICLGTGEWTSLNDVCTECPFGFALFKQNCYKFISEAKSFKDAKTYCQSFKGEVSSFESEDERDFLINEVVRKPWILKKDILDYAKVMFKQLEKDEIGHVLEKGQLRQARNKEKKASFVCRLTSRTPSKCDDIFDACANLFKSNPDACEKFPGLMKTNCKKTCGLCNQ